jgi:hypothetical protein
MCAILAALVSPAMAQEEAAPAGPNTGAVSFSMGVDFTTAYFFRGIVQENQGLIYQPWADATFQLTDSLSVYLGTWNSIHDNATAAGNQEQWYESDFFVGASYSISECLSADVSYIWLYSPGGGGEFSQEVNIGLSYDDSGLWGDGFDGLQPAILVGIETSGGSDMGTDKGTYLELGISPSFTVVESASSPITLTIPVTVGLGWDYYEGLNDATGVLEDDTFGYLDIGLDFSMPLSFVPAQFGSWEAAAGVHFLFLGDSAENINTSTAWGNPGQGVGSGDDFEVIGTFGISMSY